MKKLKFNKKGVLATLAISAIVGFASLAMAVATVDLGVADPFVVFGYASVTNVPTSVITGDLGLSPAAGSFYDGGVTGAQVTGTIYAVDASGPVGSVANPSLLTPASTAISDAYTDASGRTGATVLSGSDNQLGGLVLTPGVYSFSHATTANLVGTTTLSGDGVYIFQAASDFVSAASSTVELINGAQACNVFWTFPSAAGQFGVGTTFKGTVIAGTSITDAGYSNIEGRLFAKTGTVALNHTTLWKPSCVTPPPAPVVTSGGTPVPLPLIDIIKVPNPLALPSGPGTVTYNYTVKNIGVVAISGVIVTDDKCSPIIPVTGDQNSNGMIDPGKTWTYKCTKYLTQTETNTATVVGQAYGNKAYDTANATVVVKASLVPPLIHVVKVPNKFLLPLGGGAVTYSYTITNPGTAPLSTVSIVDDKCTGLPGRVVGHPGDLNKNNILESNEVWQFTCQTNITKTTTNRATAEGHANGLTAIDYAQATVAVGTPALPNTGYGPEDKNLLNILVPAGIVALLFSLYIARRKYTV